MKKMTTLFIIIIALTLLMGSCKKYDVLKGTPSCIRKIIRKNNKCLDKVYEYSFRGEAVYLFVPTNCPDALYNLYDKNCNLVCSPSGGISGNGDGKCSDFYQQSTNEKLVYLK
jgi:hypothetical protein